MPKKIFAIKPFSGNPIDSIDNVLTSALSRIPASEIEYRAEGPFEERGALKRRTGSRWKELRSGGYDALWGIGTVHDIPYLLLRPRSLPYVINFHTILIRGKDGPWQPKTPWFLRAFMFARAALVITPSEFSAGTVRRYFPRKQVVGILNGVDLAMFNPSRKDPAMLAERYKIRTDKPLVVFVGTLQERKRPDIFIELARRFPEANFVMVGKQYPQWDFLSKAEGVPNFQWIPMMPRTDVAALLSSSMAFIFPSLNEPAAAVVLESMASGTVPLLSDSGGNPEFLGKSGDAAGYLVPRDEREMERFLEILHVLVSDPAMRDRKAAAARREAERHSYDAVAGQYRDTILSLWKKD
jgi:glycosyltransferase involved in cell wall biosynthesis